MRHSAIGVMFQIFSLFFSLIVLPLIFFLLFTNSLVRQSIVRNGVVQTLVSLPKTLSCSTKHDSEKEQSSCMGWKSISKPVKKGAGYNNTY